MKNMKKKSSVLLLCFLICVISFYISGKNVYAAASMELGETKTIYAASYIAPSYPVMGGINKTYVWTVSNSNVVEIIERYGDSCRVRAVGTGTATVSCMVSMSYKTYDYRLNTDLPRFEQKYGGGATITVNRSSGNLSGSSSGSSSGNTSVKPAEPTGVTLDKTKVSLYAGKNVTLKPTVYPTALTSKITWKSNKPKIASVNSKGKVTAKKQGTAVITAKTYNGKTVDCIVTVKLKPSKVKLNKSKVTLEKGKKLQLKATVSPKGADKSLKWSSSNKNVARVNASGKVTAVGKGNATITVKTVNGKKATCKITVKITPTGIQLDQAAVYMYKGKKGQLKANVLPDGAKAEVTWKSSKTSVVSINKKGIMTAKKTGTANITATMKGTKKKAVCKVTVYNIPKQIKLSNNSLTMGYKESTKLIYELGPSPTYADVVWTSSNPEAVSVDQNGIVRVLKADTSAVITAKVSKSLKAECKITVRPLKPQYFDLYGESEYLESGQYLLEKGQCMQCRTVITPEEANGPVQWTSDNLGTATVSSTGLVTCVGSGTAKITASRNGETRYITVVGIEDQVIKEDSGKGQIIIDVNKRQIRYPGQKIRSLNLNKPVLLTGRYENSSIKIINSSISNLNLQIILDNVTMIRNMSGASIDLQEVRYGNVEFVLKNTSQIKQNYSILNEEPLIKLPENGSASVKFTGTGRLNMECESVVIGGNYAVGNVRMESGTYSFGSSAIYKVPIIGCQGDYMCSNIFIGSAVTIYAKGGLKVVGSEKGIEQNIVIQGDISHFPNVL